MIHPTFYFRPISNAITLSYAFGITLRNPSEDELPVLQKSLKTLCQKLSDKERRRIIYTLYPLGINDCKDSIAELFIKELSKIWVIVSSEKDLPFEQGLLDYGHLCGYLSNGSFLINPGGFVLDLRTVSSRQIFRALKRELPKAARQILNPLEKQEDLYELEELCAKWDGLLTLKSDQTRFIQIAKSLRTAFETKDSAQKFLNYCLAIEILVTHNPNSHNSKMPINRQFATKTSLVRHLMIKEKKQNIMISPAVNYDLYRDIYDQRSCLLHGRGSIKNNKLAELINEIYPTLRLILDMQTTDPHLMEFLYHM